LLFDHQRGDVLRQAHSVGSRIPSEPFGSVFIHGEMELWHIDYVHVSFIEFKADSGEERSFERPTLRQSRFVNDFLG
jgi:hypothetical protein